MPEHVGHSFTLAAPTCSPACCVADFQPVALTKHTTRGNTVRGYCLLNVPDGSNLAIIGTQSVCEH